MSADLKARLGNLERMMIEKHAGEWVTVEGVDAHAPLWLSVLAQAWLGARIRPEGMSFPGLVDLVEHDAERRDALACMARLGVVSASDVLAMCAEWS